MASSNGRPHRAKAAEALNKEQVRRRTPFNMRIYICPKCGHSMRSRTNKGDIVYYKCTKPGCNHTQKVDRASGSITAIMAENEALKVENAELKAALNGATKPVL